MICPWFLAAKTLNLIVKFNEGTDVGEVYTVLSDVCSKRGWFVD